MIIRKGYTFDDVLLLPQRSEIASRKDVDISTTLARLELDVPIVSANMDTVTEAAMASVISTLGGMGILHRYASVKDVTEWITTIIETDESAFAIPSAGLHNYKEMTDLCIEMHVDALCLDVAHGHMARVGEALRYISQRFAQESVDDIEIIAGNVATYEGAVFLVENGATVVKVGVGPGSQCTTRTVTGHGVPQLSAIMDVARVKHIHNATVGVIADGGIKNSGDVVKALAAGADAVMIGGLFAGTDETPGDAVGGYKEYRGMASREAREYFYGDTPSDYVPEGVAIQVPCKGSVNGVFNDLVGGIRSGMAYSGAATLAELRKRAKFIEVTPLSLTETGTRNV